MYSGEEVHFCLRCRDDNSGFLINTIVDTFGRDIRIEDDGNDYFLANFSSAAGGVELFAMQYADECTIILPRESADRVKAVKSGRGLCVVNDYFTIEDR